MTHHRSRRLLTIAILAALPLAAACGGDETSSIAMDTPGAAAEGTAGDTAAGDTAAGDTAAGAPAGGDAAGGDTAAYCAKVEEVAAKGSRQVDQESLADMQALESVAPQGAVRDSYGVIVSKVQEVVAFEGTSEEIMVRTMEVMLSPEMMAAMDTVSAPTLEWCGVDISSL